MRGSFSRSVMLLALAALAPPLDDERIERAKPRPEPEPGPTPEPAGLPEAAATVPS